MTVAGVLCAAAFVRLHRIDLTWYFLDQVRDVSTAIDIATGKHFPLLGPLIGWTSGRLGPLYFYLISPPFLFTENPLAGMVFVALVNVVAVFVCYQFVREYFGASVALVASALLAVFPLGVFSSRVLWNPALVPLFGLLFMQALFAVVVRGRSRGIVWMCAWLAVLTQLHLTTAALGVVALLALAIWRPRVRLIHILAGLGIFIALYAPYLRYELSHRFENTWAIVRGLGANQQGTGQWAFPSVLRSLAVLYRPAIDGFVVADPWPPLLLNAFSLLYGAEALVFCAGAMLGVWRLIRDRKATAGAAIATRRALGLLLLWLLVPVVLLGTRRTPLWWYYFDLLYPSPFVFAGLALSSIAALRLPLAWMTRAPGSAAATFVLAVIVSQTWFQVGLQQRIDRQGQLVFDVPRFSVAAAPVSLAILPSLPYGYRARLLGTLVTHFGMPSDAFSQRVHSSVLGRPDENQHLLRFLEPAAVPAREPHPRPDSHYLVAHASDIDVGIRSLRSTHVGPYVVVEYQPRVDYRSWRCALRPAATTQSPAAVASSERHALPARAVALELTHGGALFCEGLLLLPEDDGALRLVVSLVADAPLRILRADTPYGVFVPATLRSWQSPSLYWTSEAVFTLRGLRSADCTLLLEIAGTGHLLGLDVYE